MRWQARLESDWADRFLPWIGAGLLAITFFALAEAKVRSGQGSPSLASAAQGAWLIAHFKTPHLTLTDTHLLAQHLPLGFYPVGWLTRFLPTVPTLLVLQSASLGVGVVPLWRLARDVALLRTGAALALCAVYGLSPTLNNLALSGFNPAAVAVSPLLGATYLALRGKWRPFAIVSATAVMWSAELGLVIAGLGLLVLIQGERKIGRRTAIAGIAWTVIAVLVIEPRYGSTGFIAPGAFRAYGDNAFSILIGMAGHPFKLLGDLFAEDNVRLIVGLLAPLLFLPVLAPRYLLPAIPLQVLYLVADVTVRGTGTNEYGLPLTVFAFVAATFALQRMGRRSIERVLVDRRVLSALAVAAIGFFLLDASNSPYQRPWDWGKQNATDTAREHAADAVRRDERVRASASMVVLLAERTTVLPLGSTPNAVVALDGVDTVVIDGEDVSWSTSDWLSFGAEMQLHGYRLESFDSGVRVYSDASG
jgi:uncharacterized membrane protein